MDDELKVNLTAKQTWLRGLFILIVGFLLAIARVVLWAVVLLQFLFTLFTGKINEKLLNFSSGLSRFVYQCVLFLTFNTDDKPFPFDDWPSGEGEVGAGKAVNKKPAKKSAARKSVKKKAAADISAESAETGGTESIQGKDASTPEKPEN